jgi:long-subunit acyl-CoA synthetase (AMP-forming)
MLGYWGDVAHTSEVLRDGRLRTGDIARCDEGGSDSLWAVPSS